MPERGHGDQVADAASSLAGYVQILERLLAEPVADGAAPGFTARGAAAPEPWYSPAGHALMDAIEGVPRLEAALRYAVAGNPGRRRGGSAGNFTAALKALPGLVAGLAAEDADVAVKFLNKWIDAAKSVHGIDERRRLRHLPRRAGERLPPRCPNCMCFQLVADLDARVVYCTHPGCLDRNGLPPVASLATTGDGRPALFWADGLTEIAPDVDDDPGPTAGLGYGPVMAPDRAIGEGGAIVGFPLTAAAVAWWCLAVACLAAVIAAGFGGAVVVLARRVSALAGDLTEAAADRDECPQQDRITSLEAYAAGRAPGPARGRATPVSPARPPARGPAPPLPPPPFRPPTPAPRPAPPPISRGCSPPPSHPQPDPPSHPPRAPPAGPRPARRTQGPARERPAMTDDNAWLRQAMQLILARLGDEASSPLVLTVVAFTGSAGGGQLVQLTMSARGKGRIYERVLDPEEIRTDANSTEGGGRAALRVTPAAGGTGNEGVYRGDPRRR